MEYIKEDGEIKKVVESEPQIIDKEAELRNIGYTIDEIDRELENLTNRKVELEAHKNSLQKL